MNKKILRLIKKYNLDLSGLVILTEAASDAYLLNPFIALAAGATKVICKTKATPYGLVSDIIKSTFEIAKKWELSDRISIKENLELSDLAQADIITNSGHLRPITQEQIAQFKPTAVIPLMWETWEFRSTDLDLNACKERGILVLGTNESNAPCDMSKYSAMIGVKLLLELGTEITENKILLVGSTTTLCASIKSTLKFLGAEVVWFSSSNINSDFFYPYLKEYIQENAIEIDAIVIAEHHFAGQIFGKNGLISFSDIAKLNSDIKVGISCGNIDIDDLKSSRFLYFPKHIQPFGHMSYQSYHIGPLPVMDLFAAGLKVGEVMARSRLSGMPVKKAVLYSLKNSPAMDFEGNLSWL